MSNQNLLPFLWLKGEDEAAIREGVRQIAEAGCGSLCAESRVHPDFLGLRWWRDINILTDACKRHGLTFWLLDDLHFPSGYANGAAQGTPWARMHLTERRMDVVGPRKGGCICAWSDEEQGIPVAVIAARRVDDSGLKHTFLDIGGWKVSDLIDLTDLVKDGLVFWDVPEGTWRVFVLTAKYVSERSPAQVFANPLLPDSGRLMIETIYEPHRRHLGADFGTVFKGFFSDEPALRAGRGYHAVLGEFPMIPVPWRLDMPEILSEALGEDARRLLPGLWYDIGEETERVRYAFMDAVSRLYGENFSMKIGDWCREHGVEYIGHVIEQNDAHSRLGPGAGHFFRAISGQDWAGMDIVLHELKSDFRDTSHAWKSQDFEADDNFFRYMLPQMTVSAAALDPKKKGRALCEIFGAYGWQEDAREMRYLANCLMARGINRFTPHAYTLTPFPDRDSPPHFGDFNPLNPHIARLFGAMSRVTTLLDGGCHDTRVGVLYYAEAEWAGGSGCMKTHTVVRELNRRQIECEIVPIDLVDPARYDALLIPRAEVWPLKLCDMLDGLRRAGCAVGFVDAFPSRFCDGTPGGDWSEGCEVVPLAETADWTLRHAKNAVTPLEFTPLIHCYPYRRAEGLLLALFNEDEREAHAFRFRLEEMRAPRLYDPETDETWILPGKDGVYEVSIEPGQLLIAGNVIPGAPEAKPMERWRVLNALSPRWTITFEGLNEPPVEADGFAAERLHPRFSGVVRCEAELDFPPDTAALRLTGCESAVTVSVDGEVMGLACAAPYRFELPRPMEGRHRLNVALAVPLFWRYRDDLSFFNYVPSNGIQGPVELLGKA